MKKIVLSFCAIMMLFFMYGLEWIQVLASEELYAEYMPVITQYQEALRKNLYVDILNGVSNNWDEIGEYINIELLSGARYYRNYGASNSENDFYIYYAIADINGDGINELFIGAGDVEHLGLYDMFSFDGEQVIPVFDVGTFGYRTNLHIYENGTFAVDGSGGASQGSITYYTLPQKACIPASYAEYAMVDGVCFYTDKNGNQMSISEEEYLSRISTLAENEWSFTWNLIDSNKVSETQTEATIDMSSVSEGKQGYAPLENAGKPNTETNMISSLINLSYIGNCRFSTPYYFTDEQGFSMRPVVDQGILGCLPLDYDKDGDTELLVITYEKSFAYEDRNSVRLSMYEQIDDQWLVSDKIELLRKDYEGYVRDLSSMYISESDAFEGNFFIRNYNGQYQLFYETAYFEKYFTTGSGWSLTGFTYNGTAFEQISGTEYLSVEGSGPLIERFYELNSESLSGDEYAQGYVNAINCYRSLEFASEKVGYGNSTVSQDPYSYVIVKLLRGDNVEEQDISTWMVSREKDLKGFWIDVEDHIGEIPVELPVFTQKQTDLGNTEKTIGQSSEDDYIMPDSNISYLSQEEVFNMGLNKQQLRLARNEIYARHGRIFNTPEIREYFESKAWYVPKYSSEEFDANLENMLNEVEISNIDVIESIEEITVD